MSHRNHTIPLVAWATAVLLTLPGAAAQTTWYVDDDAPNDPGPGDPTVSDPNEDGSAEHPFDAIQEGIDAATPGDEVLVLDGKYADLGNRDLDFAGKPITVRSENGPDNCLVDCEGSLGQPHRGFYFHSGETAAAVVDGFTITNGCELEGGGVGCWGSSPTITSCVIKDNIADDYEGEWSSGGGIYCQNSSPAITDCVIIGNETGYYGDGGGICCYYSDATITNCAIAGNAAGEENVCGGGGVFCAYSDATISDCTIAGNMAGEGGGVRCYQSSPTITNCVIRDNIADAWPHGGLGGGGLSFYGAAPTIANCTITGNYADGYYGSGGIDAYYTDIAIVDCIISGNQGVDAGGICCGPWGTITNCTITGNYAWQGGGGIAVSHTSATVTNCTITGNVAGWDGGGVSCADGTLANCTIAGNIVIYGGSPDQYGGGGVSCWGNPTITNCAITGNTAPSGGGAVHCWESSPALSNCILWANTPNEIGAYHNSNPTLTYCDVWDGWTGEGNIDADPLFADPDGPDNDPNTWEDNDYHLSGGSPCIDAGDNDAVPPDSADLDGDGDTDEPIPFDLDGNPRFVDDPGMPDDGNGTASIIDMGAYEFQDETCFGDLDGDGEISLSDLAALLANYGTASGAVYTDGDLDRDDDVDLSDLAALLAVYGTTCE